MTGGEGREESLLVIMVLGIVVALGTPAAVTTLGSPHGNKTFNKKKSDMYLLASLSLQDTLEEAHVTGL